MLQNTLSALLQSVASRYAELSPSDVGIGLRGGRLVVDDVQLRADTFNGPHIPFHVLEGRAGRLRVNVPWSALTDAPVQLYLENVHLIAGPKHSYPDPAAHPSKRSSKRSSASAPHWHQTNVGRLLFNVSVEMYGIKVEYRDPHCVGIISVASLHAYSAGPEWQRRFASLTSALDPNSPHATAVTMRKLVRLGGVHWVMIPRTNNAAEQPSTDPPQAPPASPRYEHRRMDLQSYESRAPILDGIPISVKVLLHSGTAQIDDQFIPGLHAEIHVDIEDPSVNLTARQIKWIDNIVKAGFGLGAVSNHPPSKSHPARSAVPTPKRRRPQPPSDTKQSSAPTSEGINEDDTDRSEAEGSVGANEELLISSQLEKELAHQLRKSRSNFSENSSRKHEAQYAEQPLQEHDEDSHEEYEEDDLIIVQDPNSSEEHDAPPQRGGLRSFWQAIVSENADDTVDDAAIVLGLANGHAPDEEDTDTTPEAEDGVEAEHQFAREAVNAAAEAGGLTLQLVLRTPDHQAWQKVKKLEEELEEEKKLRTSLEDAERILRESEQRVQDSETLAQKLRDRNEALVKELQDLEQMTSQAGKNKDAMIRQMEAALVKAEKNLQAMLQAKFKKDANSAITKSIQVNTYQEEVDVKPVFKKQSSTLQEGDAEKQVPKNPEKASGTQKVPSLGSGGSGDDGDPMQKEHVPKILENGEQESKDSLDRRATDVVNEPTERNTKIPPSVSGYKEKDRIADIASHANTATKGKQSDGTNGTILNTSASAPVGGQEQSLTEVQLHNDRYSQLSLDAPSVSITKLIADMSTKVDVVESSHSKHLEATMSSEGLTLI
ncbi:unnamed protein product [Agarophyton chilense]